MSLKVDPESKIMPHLQAAIQIVNSWRKNKEKIIFTNGCFDIFHAGHAYALYEASKLGTKLIVGLNDDYSIKDIKGLNRPFVELKYRAFVLAALSSVDLVVPFSESNPRNLILSLLPDVLVKGNDYKLDQVVGADIVLANNGSVVTVPLIPGLSSTLLASNIFKNMKNEPH